MNSCELPRKAVPGFAVSCSKSCSWICCEQLWTVGEAVPWPAMNCWRTVPRSALDNCDLLEKQYVHLLVNSYDWWRSFTCICCGQLWTDEETLPVSAVDSCELMRSFTCICCGHLWTDEKLYLYLLWTSVNWWEALPVSAVDSCELMEKVYLYLLWTAMNWWRSFTCVCCGHLWTDEKLYLYLLWTAVN